MISFIHTFRFGKLAFVMLDVCLLGTGGMMPLPNRWLSSLLMRYNGRMFLVDCGEGTQIPLKLSGWGFKALDTIFFTHFHADHISGLPGLLLTLGNSGKTDPLNLVGPPGLKKIVESLIVISPNLPYPLHLYELPYVKNLGTQEEHGYPLCDQFFFRYSGGNHNIPCLTYSFEISRPGKFNPGLAKELNIPLLQWSCLQGGQTVTLEDGRTIEPHMVLGEPRRGIKLCYCTDTRPTSVMPTFFKDADLLICEGLYGDDENLENAAGKKHMVFSEAATLAKESNASELWLTHFSPALKTPSEFICYAQNIFVNTKVGVDLLSTTLRFVD